MPLLEGERKDALIARLSGDSPEETPLSESETIPEPESTQEAFPASESEEAAAEEDHPHNVPYNRFKEVIGRRNELQDELEERGQELLYMRARMDQMQEMYEKQAAPRPSYYKEGGEQEFDLFSDDDDDGSGDQDNDRLAQLEARIAESEGAAVSNELEREVFNAIQTYDDVPEQVIYEAIAYDGNITALEAAENYRNFVAEIEEAALARHVAEQKATDAAPRVHSVGSTKTNVNTGLGGQPSTMEDAHTRLLEYLRK